MKQITEDYVSFETAKLLKEKGFNIPCRFNYRSMYPNSPKPFYHKSLKDFNGKEYEGLRSEWFSAPTQSLALKWLRENNFHIIIDIEVDYDEDERGMKWYHKSAWYWIVYRIDDREQMSDNGDLYLTYEEACEAAIKYCLENLI